MSSFESPRPVRSSNSRVAALGKRPSLTHRCSDPEFSDSELDDAVDMGENAVWANLEEPIYTEKDIEVFRPTQEGSSLPIYYTRGWLPFSADTLFNTLLDIRYRPLWDNNIDQVHVVEHQHVSDVLYYTFKLPWPFANRDYVYRRRVKFYPTQNAFVVLYQAAHHADAPAQTSCVRVETCRLRLCIRNLSTSQDSCDFHLEYEDDTNFSLPNYVINLLLRTMMPSFLTKLQKACAGYADYFQSIPDREEESMPSQVLRHRSAVLAEAMSETTKASVPDKKTGIRASVTEERKPVRGSQQPRPQLFLRRSATKENTLEDPSSVSEDEEDAARSTRPTPFRHSMVSTYGDYLHHSSSAHDFESQPSMAPLSISEFSRVSSLASVQTAPFDKDEALIPNDDDFVVHFRKQKIGLHLESDLYSNKIIVAYCEKYSEAAASTLRIEPGFLVTSVNGKSVSDRQVTNILSEIQRAKRPLTLGFSYPEREDFLDYRRYTEPQNVVRCLIARENDVLSSLRPLDEDAAISAVLYRDFVALAATSVTESSSLGTGFLDQPVSSLHPSVSLYPKTERVLIPAGYLVYEVNDSVVLDVPFADIAHLLQRSQNDCFVTFKAATSIVGSKQRSLKGRHHLSRRFPGIFRKKRRESNASLSTAKSSTSSREWANERELSTEYSQYSSDTQVKHRVTATTEDCGLTDYSSVTVTASNMEWVWRQVLKLKATERIFSAASLIDRLETFLAANDSDKVIAASQMRVKHAMEAKHELIDHIKERREQGVKALKEFNDTNEDADWQFGQTMLGVTTSWKPDEDGSLWIKLEGLVDGVDIFHTISVIREVDLFNVWIPFCSRSLLLEEMGHVELAAYVAISSPFLQRDAILRAFGINAVYEHRCLLLLGGSVDDSTLSSSVRVPTLQGWNAGRMEIKGFRALIEPLTRMQARTCIVVNLDPKCAIPKAMLNFGIKKMAGVLLYLIRKEAEKIEVDQNNPHASARNEHVCRITNDPSGFYTWLRPIVDQFFRDQQEKKPIGLPNVAWTTESDEPHVSDSRRKSPRSSSLGLVSRRSTRISPLQRNGVRISVLKPLSVETPSILPASHWSDALYNFTVWPYVLLYFMAKLSAGLPFLYACGLKLGFTCACTWLAVPGAFPRATRYWKRVQNDLNPLCRQYVVFAAICDVLSSYAIRVWVHWIQCYVHAILYGATTTTRCFSRPLTEVRESEQLFLILFCFLYASAVVGMQIQVAVNR